MGKAGGIMAIIGGIFGMLAGFATLFLGGLGGAVGAEGAGTVVSFGMAGIGASLLTVVSGGISLAKPRMGGIGSIVLSLFGIILGGTLVAMCLALGLIGGILAVLEKPKPDANGNAEPARRRWLALTGSLVGGLTLAISVGSLTNSTAKPGAIIDAAATADATAPQATVGQTATGQQFAVTLNSFQLLDNIGQGVFHEQAGPGTVFVVLDITVKCIDKESRWYSSNDLFATVGGRELKFDKQETIIGVTKVFGAINPLTEQRGIIVFKIPLEAAQGPLTWQPGRGFGALRFAFNLPVKQAPAIATAAPVKPAPENVLHYRNGSNTLDITPQNDGSFQFDLFAVSELGNTGEIGGIIQARNGVVNWKNAESDCELTFRWQRDKVTLEQQGMCQFGMGVYANGEYVKGH